METQQFYANGKLLIAGEYLVLDGAKALAAPTTYGQHLSVSPLESDNVRWTSFDADGRIWFETQIPLKAILSGLISDADKTTQTLVQILHQTSLMAPRLFGQSGFQIQTRLTFPRLWGLGSSSTLIHLMAQWAQIDPFALSDATLGGSGYDIACAGHDHSLYYQKTQGRPTVTRAYFAPDFAHQLWFVYRNQKQDSREAIETYRRNRENLTDQAATISQLSAEMAQCTGLGSFMRLMSEHERVVGELLQTQPVKSQLFPDFAGAVKSLGGWGGDFIMVASHDNPTEYFRSKGFHVVVPYRAMIREN